MDSRPVVNIGEQRFDMLVGEKKFYIDKTELIREWWEYGSAVTLITRPRRFGKTLNLSMLECFFSVKFAGRGDLFEGFSIWKDGSSFNSTFKTNENIYRGIITGITRISKESIFSDLNNLDVITTTSDEYASCFGFTEEEVFDALDMMGLGGEKQGVKKWYDGFTFGKCTDIYNPWSITSFIKKKGRFEAYWANTSSNELVNSLIQSGSPDIKKTMEGLLQGKGFEAKIDEQIVFEQLNGSANAVWSLLLATGYLKVLDTKTQNPEDEAEITYTLAFTNFEVARMFRKMIEGWFGSYAEAAYNGFIRALLMDDVKRMNTFMNKVALQTFSYFDSGNRPSGQAEPERFYHGFVLGMVVNLAGSYQVRSNRESGLGRYDVMIEPHDRNGKAFIFEFKVFDADGGEKTLNDTLSNALAQIKEKRYKEQLISEGFRPGQIRQYGFAFKGKECLIG